MFSAHTKRSFVFNTFTRNKKILWVQKRGSGEEKGNKGRHYMADSGPLGHLFTWQDTKMVYCVLFLHTV